MTRTQKPYYDEQGNFIVRPYRIIDLAAIYGVSTKTIRRWLDNKVPEDGRKTRMYFSIEQVSKIITALGVPHKISTAVPMPQLKQAV